MSPGCDYGGREASQWSNGNSSLHLFQSSPLLENMKFKLPVRPQVASHCHWAVLSIHNLKLISNPSHFRLRLRLLFRQTQNVFVILFVLEFNISNVHSGVKYFWYVHLCCYDLSSFPFKFGGGLVQLFFLIRALSLAVMVGWLSVLESDFQRISNTKVPLRWKYLLLIHGHAHS